MARKIVSSGLGRTIQLARDESGPTAVEYALMLALVVMGAATVIMAVGQGARAAFAAVAAIGDGAA